MNCVKNNLLYFIGHTTIGIIALIYVLLRNLPDGSREGMISGIVGGFIITGILGIIISLRLMRNPQRAMEIDLTKNEERTQFLRTKTNASIHTVMIYVESAATLLSWLLGFREISLTLATILAIQIVLFIGFVSYYNKKY
jgi:uncharacterized membrane protein